MPPSRGRARAPPTYVTSLTGKWKHTPTPWRWPALWAMVFAASVQLFAGVFATLLSLVLLIAADPQRCPVAVGAESSKPLFAWVIGVVIGVVACHEMTVLVNNPSASWVFWGFLAELEHMIFEGTTQSGTEIFG